MPIEIIDDSENWLKWGTLVKDWACDHQKRPTSVPELQAQITEKGIVAMISDSHLLPGSLYHRPVNFHQLDQDALTIPLPSCEMILQAQARLESVSFQPPGQRKYPLPSFYAIPFGGASEVDLSTSELMALLLRRLGERVIRRGE